MLSGCSLVTDLGGLSSSGDVASPSPEAGDADRRDDGSSGSDGGAGIPDATGESDPASTDAGHDGSCTSKTTGFRSGTIAMSGPGDTDEVSWTMASGALTASDGMQAASALTIGFDKSRPLFVTGFGFEVPASASVLDVTIEITRRGADHEDESVKLVSLSGAGVPSYGAGDLFSGASWPTTLGPRVYVGSALQWGKALDPATVNAAGFGVSLVVQYKGNGAAEAFVDAVRASVRYCE